MSQRTSRRTFLMQSAISGAGMSRNLMARPQGPSANAKIRIAIVGVGVARMGRSHVEDGHVKKGLARDQRCGRGRPDAANLPPGVGNLTTRKPRWGGLLASPKRAHAGNCVVHSMASYGLLRNDRAQAQASPLHGHAEAAGSLLAK
jgi:hypothetical protein